jgi:hypothetical protein
MLRKMYLVLAEDHRPSPPRICRKRPLPRRRRQRPTLQHPHTEWIKLRTKHPEAQLRRNARSNEVADYMKQRMPAATISLSPSPPPTYSCLNVRQNQDAVHTNVTAAAVAADTYAPLKRYTRRRNTNLS